jgi:hypothetical protein
MLCIGGVLLPAGSPASVSSTRKATSPFLYFHTSRFYLSRAQEKACPRSLTEEDRWRIQISVPWCVRFLKVEKERFSSGNDGTDCVGRGEWCRAKVGKRLDTKSLNIRVCETRAIN